MTDDNTSLPTDSFLSAASSEVVDDVDWSSCVAVLRLYPPLNLNSSTDDIHTRLVYSPRRLTCSRSDFSPMTDSWHLSYIH